MCGGVRMFDYLYEWMQNIAFYMIMVTAVMHVIPNSDYKRYIRFFTGLVLAVMLASPLLKLLGMGDVWQNLYENEKYQEQVRKMEEAAKYLQGTEAKQESKEELDNIRQEDSGEMSISIEEIEVGRD
jgi:stage III sporulation protein AF